MTDLVAIAKGHIAATREALNRRPDWLVLDPDPLMTAVWADMLFPRARSLVRSLQDTADLYLMFVSLCPWLPEAPACSEHRSWRSKFFELSRLELERRGVPWTMVRGHGEDRFENAMKAIGEATEAGRSLSFTRYRSCRRRVLRQAAKLADQLGVGVEIGQHEIWPTAVF